MLGVARKYNDRYEAQRTLVLPARIRRIKLGTLHVGKDGFDQAKIGVVIFEMRLGRRARSKDGRRVHLKAAQHLRDQPTGEVVAVHEKRGDAT